MVAAFLFGCLVGYLLKHSQLSRRKFDWTNWDDFDRWLETEDQSFWQTTNSARYPSGQETRQVASNIERLEQIDSRFNQQRDKWAVPEERWGR